MRIIVASQRAGTIALHRARPFGGSPIMPGQQGWFVAWGRLRFVALEWSKDVSVGRSRSGRFRAASGWMPAKMAIALRPEERVLN